MTKTNETNTTDHYFITVTLIRTNIYGKTNKTQASTVINGSPMTWLVNTQKAINASLNHFSRPVIQIIPIFLYQITKEEYNTLSNMYSPFTDFVLNWSAQYE